MARKGNRNQSLQTLHRQFGEKYDHSQWQEALKLLETIQAVQGNGAWVYYMFSTVFYEMYDYQLALDYAEKAKCIAPHSPKVIWAYAMALRGLKNHEAAIPQYERIVKMGENRIVEKENVIEYSLEAARRLICDCHFNLGENNYVVGNDTEALIHINIYLDLIKSGAGSLYDIEDAAKLKERILDAMR